MMHYLLHSYILLIAAWFAFFTWVAQQKGSRTVQELCVMVLASLMAPAMYGLLHTVRRLQYAICLMCVEAAGAKGWLNVIPCEVKAAHRAAASCMCVPP